MSRTGPPWEAAYYRECIVILYPGTDRNSNVSVKQSVNGGQIGSGVANTKDGAMEIAAEQGYLALTGNQAQ